jgi:predicted lipoprotein with Yx(FWY)xxD motif
MLKLFLSLVSSAALLFATAAFAQNALTKTGESAKGKVLTDAKGMTLYTFDKDAGGKSACNGPCATNWPPLMASGDAKPAGSYTIVGRDDGSKQWAYKGKPLYTWQKDQKPGDVTGDGFNGAWHIAQP